MRLYNGIKYSDEEFDDEVQLELIRQYLNRLKKKKDKKKSAKK